MDSKLLLVNAITLLFKEGLLEDPTECSSALVKQIVGSIRLPEIAMDSDPARLVIPALKTTALWMSDNPPGYRYDRANLLQRIRVNVGDDEGLFLAILGGLEETDTKDLIKQSCLSMRRILKQTVDRALVKDIIRKASGRVHYEEEKIDWKTFVLDLQNQLEPFMHNATSMSNEGVVDEVCFDDAEAVSKLLQAAVDDMSSVGILKTGLQGINRMTGELDGLRRGEFVVVPALQHNYKTGFTLNLFRQLCVYNTPHMTDPTKKPMMIRISTEDSLRDNIMGLYVQIYQNETKQVCDVSAVDPVAAAQYVKTYLERTGYTVRMMRWNPSEVGFQKIFDTVTYYESQGYEIHAIVFDYLNMISKAGCLSNGPQGSEIRDLFRRTRNFMSARKILFVSPHQLSTEAKMLIRQDVDNFLQGIAGKGYYDSCRTIDQEVDLEIYIHIVKINGVSYLTIQRGKHRKPFITPESDHYCVYKFDGTLGILDDLDGPNQARKHAGGGTAGSADEVPWFAQTA